MANSVYSMIADKLIAEMNKGIIPWHKPWSFCGNANDANVAINWVSKRPYNFLNQLFLDGGEWITFGKIKEFGFILAKGAKSKEVYAAFPTKEIEIDDDGNETEKVWFSMKYYRVFNIKDVTDKQGNPIPSRRKEIEPTAPTTAEPIDIAENTIKGYVERTHLKFYSQASDRAYYAPREDKVVVPSLAQYKCKEEYYSTTFHELTHSSGAENRLNRKGVTDFDAFGSHQYGKEELIAEMGAAMIVTALGLDTSKCFKNSVAYLQSWTKAIKAEPKIVAFAALQAEKAAKYILNEK